ncbi:unnamed protein product [Rhodiola kirilowii]
MEHAAFILYVCTNKAGCGSEEDTTGRPDFQVAGGVDLIFNVKSLRLILQRKVLWVFGL